MRIQPAEFRGDIHLHREERRWMSQVHEITGEDTPFWIIVAGGKRDFTIKWWDVRRWQAVVDHFRGRIQFVQVGEAGHHHPALSGVIDLRGKADLRQLVRLVYHAQGVLCPVTSLMHLAAAVPMKGARASSPQSRNGNGNHPSPQNRPCVVVAGGREPPHWEAYPHHQFIHTNGQLLCCDHGGCWKARTVPLGDGDEKDAPSQLCVDVVPSGQAADTQHSTFTTQPPPPLPRCMDMITAEEVILRIEGYFTGGAARYLTAAQAAGADGGGPPMEGCLSPEPAPQASGRVFRRTDRRRRRALEAMVKAPPRYPARRFRGRGIVICGGGAKYFPCAWVAVKMLRHLGCTLPIELWHLGAREMTAEMQAMVEPLGVRCIDGLEMRKRHPVRRLGGWEMKAYALMHSRFAEVLLLDADNVALRDPEFLFDTPEYRAHGAIFWPDFGRLEKHRAIWSCAAWSIGTSRNLRAGRSSWKRPAAGTRSTSPCTSMRTAISTTATFTATKRPFTSRGARSASPMPCPRAAAGHHVPARLSERPPLSASESRQMAAPSPQRTHPRFPAGKPVPGLSR